MRRKSISVVVTIAAVWVVAALTIRTADAQEPEFFYYGWKGEKMPLPLSREKIGIKFEKDLALEDKVAILATDCLHQVARFTVTSEGQTHHAPTVRLPTANNARENERGAIKPRHACCSVYVRIITLQCLVQSVQGAVGGYAEVY